MKLPATPDKKSKKPPLNAVALAAILILATGIAAVQSLQTCGVLDQKGNYTLSQDIDADTPICFRITSSNVNLDCQNHRIQPAWIFHAKNTIAIAATGADENQPLRNLNIQNCQIQKFATGIRLDDIQTFTVQNNTITNTSQDGIDLQTTRGPSKIFKNTITKNGGYGIWANDSKNIRFEGNQLREQDKDQIAVQNGRNNDVEENQLAQGHASSIHIGPHEVGTDIRENDVQNTGGDGIRIDGESQNSTVNRNTIKAAKNAGIRLGPGTQYNTLKANRISQSGQGIQLEPQADQNRFDSNRLEDQIEETIVLNGASGNRFENNAIREANSKTTPIQVVNHSEKNGFINQIIQTDNQAPLAAVQTGSKVVFINATFDPSRISVKDDQSQVTVAWHITFELIHPEGAPAGTLLYVHNPDELNESMIEYEKKGSQSKSIHLHTLTEYVKDSKTIHYHAPYQITATSGNATRTILYEVKSNANVTIFLSQKQNEPTTGVINEQKIQVLDSSKQILNGTTTVSVKHLLTVEQASDDFGNPIIYPAVVIEVDNPNDITLQDLRLTERLPFLPDRGSIPEKYPEFAINPTPTQIEKGGIVTWLFKNVEAKQTVQAKVRAPPNVNPQDIEQITTLQIIAKKIQPARKEKPDTTEMQPTPAELDYLPAAVGFIFMLGILSWYMVKKMEAESSSK